MLAHQLEMTLTEEELTAEPYCQAIISGKWTVQQKTVRTCKNSFLVVSNFNRKIHDFSRVASCFVFACLFVGSSFCVGFWYSPSSRNFLCSLMSIIRIYLIFD